MMSKAAILTGIILALATAEIRSQTATNIFPTTGNAGMGTTNPTNGVLSIQTGGSTPSLYLSGSNLDPAANPPLANMINGSSAIGSNRTGGGVETDFVSAHTSSFPAGFAFYDNNLTNSVISPLLLIQGNTGRVGIGTTSPLASLDVVGTRTNQNASGGDYLLNYSLGWSLEDPNTGDIILLVPASTGSAVVGSQFAGTIQSNRGTTGAWNLNSQWYVSVQSAYTNNTGSILPLSGQQEYATIPTLITCVYNGTTYIALQTPSGNSSSFWSLSGNWSNAQNSQKPIMVARSSVTNIATLVGYESVGSQIAITGIGMSGNVGIGTTAPAYKLDVAGAMRVQGGGIVYPDGNTQSVAWTGSLCGGDYAESIDVSDDRTKYEPGDVLIIDPNVDGKFVKSSEPYAISVAGIYSTKPGVVGRRQTTQKSPDELPMAVIGIVPVKVSTENGPIRRGDTLVTSSTPGYAMKGTDVSRMFRAVIGKAMASLEAGNGVIEVLVSLQ